MMHNNEFLCCMIILYLIHSVWFIFSLFKMQMCIVQRMKFSFFKFKENKSINCRWWWFSSRINIIWFIKKSSVVWWVNFTVWVVTRFWESSWVQQLHTTSIIYCCSYSFSRVLTSRSKYWAFLLACFFFIWSFKRAFILISHEWEDVAWLKDCW